MWNIFRTSERFRFDSENCWNFLNFDITQKRILCSFASSCRIAIESYFVFFASNMIRSVEKIIERSANAAKFCTRRVDQYMFESATIFLLLMIHNCFDNLRLRQWIFVEIRAFSWLLTVESTNAIISSTSFFDFANFVVVLRCEKIILSRWRMFLTRERQHVSNYSIYEQKRKQEIFFEFKYVFSKLLCFVCDWLVKWICSFILLFMTKRMKTIFVLESKRWLIIWFFDEFFFSCFCDLLIFFFFWYSNHLYF